jgi:hypothetical protein
VPTGLDLIENTDSELFTRFNGLDVGNDRGLDQLFPVVQLRFHRFARREQQANQQAHTLPNPK